MTSDDRQLSVVKPGNFPFLDQFNFDVDNTFTTIADDGSLRIEGIAVRDKVSGKTKLIDGNFLWNQACQCLILLSAQDEGP